MSAGAAVDLTYEAAQPSLSFQQWELAFFVTALITACVACALYCAGRCADIPVKLYNRIRVRRAYDSVGNFYASLQPHTTVEGVRILPMATTTQQEEEDFQSSSSSFVQLNVSREHLAIKLQRWWGSETTKQLSSLASVFFGVAVSICQIAAGGMLQSAVTKQRAAMLIIVLAELAQGPVIALRACAPLYQDGFLDDSSKLLPLIGNLGGFKVVLAKTYNDSWEYRAALSLAIVCLVLQAAEFVIEKEAARYSHCVLIETVGRIKRVIYVQQDHAYEGGRRWHSTPRLSPRAMGVNISAQMLRLTYLGIGVHCAMRSDDLARHNVSTITIAALLMYGLLALLELAWTVMEACIVSEIVFKLYAFWSFSMPIEHLRDAFWGWDSCVSSCLGLLSQVTLYVVYLVPALVGSALYYCASNVPHRVISAPSYGIMCPPNLFNPGFGRNVDIRPAPSETQWSEYWLGDRERIICDPFIQWQPFLYLLSIAKLQSQIQQQLDAAAKNWPIAQGNDDLPKVHKQLVRSLAAINGLTRFSMVRVVAERVRSDRSFGFSLAKVLCNEMEKYNPERGLQSSLAKSLDEVMIAEADLSAPARGHSGPDYRWGSLLRNIYICAVLHAYLLCAFEQEPAHLEPISKAVKTGFVETFELWRRHAVNAEAETKDLLKLVEDVSGTRYLPNIGEAALKHQRKWRVAKDIYDSAR